MKTKYIRTPISYYGGKQTMIRDIVPIFDGDNSTCFVSPFTGGGAIEFAIKPRRVEIWNDRINGLIVFYQVLQNPNLLEQLIARLRGQAYSEYWHNHYRCEYKKYEIIKNIDLLSDKDKVEYAAATYWMTNCSYGNAICAGFRFGRGKFASELRRRLSILNAASERIGNAIIMNRDALQIIQLFNKPDTIFYIDPPYYNANMGHYSDYCIEDYLKLLNLLEVLKGKFVLSSYDSEYLQDYAKRNKWNITRLKKHNSMKTHNGLFYITECITTNFQNTIIQLF